LGVSPEQWQDDGIVDRIWNSASVRLGSLPDEPEARRFLQGRLVLFAGVIAVISSTFFVLGFLAGPPGASGALGPLAHAAGVVIALSVWLVARRREVLAAGALTVLDGVLLIMACLAWTAMGLGLGGPIGLYTALLASLLTCLGRAIIVPTTVMRTLWTTGLALVPLPVGASLLDVTTLPVGFTASNLVVQSTLWVLSGLGVSVLASRVIYGLQEQVREAQQLGQYTLEQKIGQGGMGEVYRARHALLRRPTAVKLLSGADAAPATLQRFQQEVQLTSELSHPNTIVIYDYGHTPSGVFYYAMEYLDGLNLGELVRREGPLPPERVIHLLEQVCAALTEAHGVGLIHRDIKPENVVVGVRGGVPDFVKVLDFGLVKDIKARGEADLTAENSITGTPHYMAPEAILGRDVDARSDLYAVGCLGYVLLTGAPVFDGDSIVEICAAHLHQEPEAASKRRPGVPTDIQQVLRQCLAKDPAARPESARRLAALLTECEHAGRWTRERAEQWWGAHAASAERSRGVLADADTIAATIQVDMVRREAP
jgi:eukaryotic-like serine/threonine-protein kinase